MAKRQKTISCLSHKLTNSPRLYEHDRIRVALKGQGKISYGKVSGNKKIVINAKTGKVTVKKGLKKGTYKVKVKVRAAGNTNYKAATKMVTLTIKVK